MKSWFAIPRAFLDPGGARSASTRGTVVVASPHPTPTTMLGLAGERSEEERKTYRARTMGMTLPARASAHEPSRIHSAERRSAPRCPWCATAAREASDPARPPSVNTATTRPNSAGCLSGVYPWLTVMRTQGASPVLEGAGAGHTTTPWMPFMAAMAKPYWNVWRAAQAAVSAVAGCMARWGDGGRRGKWMLTRPTGAALAADVISFRAGSAPIAGLTCLCGTVQHMPPAL
jgi:hypothetical protein